MIGEARTWVTSFDGSMARVWSVEEGGRLQEREGDGLDARIDSETRADGARRDGGPALHRAGYLEKWSEHRFVEHFASLLAERARQGQFDRLVVAADPAALDHFHHCAPPEVSSRVIAETAKDYVHTPVAQIEAALAEHLRP